MIKGFGEGGEEIRKGEEGLGEMDMDIGDKPKPGAGDIIHTVVKASLSAIPIAGGPAAELFAAIITPPIIKRRDAWVESLGQSLLALQEKIAGFNIDDLQNNEQFITAVMHATNSASRNHDKEKLDALRNATMNAALKIEPDEDLQLIFLYHVDQLTRWHLRILSFFSSPTRWYEDNKLKKPDLYMGAPAQALEGAFLELRGNRAFYDQVIKDLYSRGLLGIESLHVTMTGQGIFESRTTDIGNRFLRFITSPID